MGTFNIVDLGDWTRGESDPGGDEAKRWFRAGDCSPYAGRWLFKPRTEKTLPLSRKRQALGDEPDVLVGGEDWAEKISYELAKLIRVPAAETELATVIRSTDRRRVWGSMSRDMRPAGWSWAPGAQLLAEVDPEFDEHSCAGHTPEAVRDVLAGVAGPYQTEYATWSAFDVFAGYLLLDAWIGNTDRHAHNWGVVQDPLSGDIYLGPSFDHGTSLASGETEARRSERVSNDGIDAWCGRGRTKRFYAGNPIGLVELAKQALSLARDSARRHWIAQIREVDLGLCNDAISAVPGLSDPTRKFVQTAIDTNRKRLCDALY
ncbi:hypothetical protein NVV99_18640 [Rhodococcus sp. PAE-6]|uniref:hypothetical protein n=1 Tax=Rhodococcus TaxID=1827 RepID=UPI0021B2F56E|nr:hypothetical protein [Rhodococcus sp. PAE-6]MCT7292953.1 hypothetical protein [Rhodococcus sp. PAE-6]